MRKNVKEFEQETRQRLTDKGQDPICGPYPFRTQLVAMLRGNAASLIGSFGQGQPGGGLLDANLDMCDIKTISDRDNSADNAYTVTIVRGRPCVPVRELNALDNDCGEIARTKVEARTVKRRPTVHVAVSTQAEPRA
ncbi:hypothetical protein EVAR_66148_1 [Eumeta japonica]|uniref:Uncharacterized protein n=1 Tax=Eumeta variegata TaxID=151549 RepID=A0A4C1Z1X1_EUMVA|nr:hypothetical protein EVAR_66148_1 [Eumeta japonica]